MLKKWVKTSSKHVVLLFLTLAKVPMVKDFFLFLPGVKKSLHFFLVSSAKKIDPVDFSTIKERKFCLLFPLIQDVFPPIFSLLVFKNVHQRFSVLCLTAKRLWMTKVLTFRVFGAINSFFRKFEGCESWQCTIIFLWSYHCFQL